MRTWIAGGVCWFVFALVSAHAFGEQVPNLVEDPSFEIPKDRDQFGLVFAKWGGWKYEGDCSFAVGQVARTGEHSCLLISGSGAKIRAAQLRELLPGRYRITAYLRGLDIGTGVWNATTEFMFDGKYMALKKNGTFGWTKLTYVADIKEKKQAGPSFGMFAPGYFWIDDVSLVKVSNDVPLTDEPALGPEETPITPPGELTADAVRCPECAYRNMPAWKKCMMERSLRKMRQYGCTTCSGIPSIAYRGFQNGQPVLDCASADARMKLAKDLGFLAVVSYGGGVSGLNAYYQDTEAMNAAGFKDYSEFVKAVYTAIQEHAEQQSWIPVYYNLGDEPIGDALSRSAENAEAYRKAFPEGPPLFTAASSFSGSDRVDPHFRLSKALHVANWNGHDEDSVNLLHEAGSDWAFYNGGNRWTFGDYLYKATKQFRLQFRISWHWNVVAGDPYYALDCREDDYAWCNASPDGQLIPAIHFEHLREGLDDYRRLLTATRLAREHAGTPAARAAEELIAKRLDAFQLGQRDHDSLFGPDDWTRFRTQIDDAIEALRR